MVIDSIRHPIRERFLSKAVLASQLVLWLLWLPLALRIHTIPTLLKHLGRRGKSYGREAIDLVEAVRIITRICNLRLFRARVFPGRCLRQSLTLYRILRQMGYPAEIHFGVVKESKNFRGHSWVTVQGEPVADTAPRASFKVIYSYPSAYALSSADAKASNESMNETITSVYSRKGVKDERKN